jgi:hypothetical protein
MSLGQGIVAKTAEKVVDAAVNTPAAANFVVSTVLDYAKERETDPALLAQVMAAIDCCCCCCSSSAVHMQLQF